MDAFPPCLSLGWIVFGYLCSAASGGEVYQKNITAECGQNITLTCRVPNNNVIVVEWSRADLKEEEYVFIYRDGHLYADGQHPSFKNRVDLQDRQMKDGDVSLILKNVTINDAGTYLCRILMKGTNRKNTKPTSTINLSVVDPPGQTGGHTEDGGKEDGVTRGHPGLVAGLSVFSVICVVVAVFVIIGKLKTSNSS